MEDKNFDKEKTAGQEHAPAGHNRRRRRRKKSGSAHHVQQPAARPEAEKTAVTPEASGSEPEKEKTEPVTEQTTEAPAVPESAEPAESPDATPEPAETPQEADQPEPPEEAEPAAEEAAHLPETAEKDAGTTTSSQDQTLEAPETPEKPAEAGEEDEEPETPEQARRAAEMTRTVQLSIEKIVENIEREESEPEEGEPAEEAETVPLTRLQQLHRRVGDSLWSLLKWMIFVVAFVAVVAGAGIAWLYKGATPDAIPQVSASFNGQDLQATSYSWHVPVVANIFKRTYADTVSKDPIEIEETIQSAQVDLDVSHPDCDTTLTVEDSTGETVFEGTAEQFGNFTFTENDTYTAELVIFRTEKKISHAAEVSGKQVYRFTFTVSLRPSIRLNTVSATQGGVVAVRASGGAAEQEAPILTSDLTATAFHRGENDWVCYLPIAVDQEPGDYTVTVSYAGYIEELSLTVKARANTFKDYSRKSQLTNPYMADSDTPAEVLALLKTGDDQPAAWSEDGFTLPFTGKAEVELAYGTTEYVGRSRSERVAGTGTGRTCSNVVVSTTRGGDLLAPAAGKVVLAQDLGGTAGYTVVIDHGAGVHSIFYCLRSISVKAGTTVKAGQVLAETDRTTIGDVRVGTVSVEPTSVWRNECDALNHY